jgi:hypothetical protein
LRESIFFSIKERIISPKILTSDGRLLNLSMTTRQQGILVNSKPTMQYSNTTGGLALVHSSKTMFKEVEFVNSSKLTGLPHTLVSLPFLRRLHLAHLLIAPWTLSLTFCPPLVMIPS